MKKYLASDLDMFLGKMPDFVLFSLFGFNLIMKPRNFYFKVHQSTYCQTLSDLV